MEETESRVVAAQDQALSSNCFKNTILKEEIESKCRARKEYEGTINNLTLECTILAKNEHTIRHGTVCTHLHYSVCMKLGIETAENRY
jgi:hypothetical protein